MNIQRFTCKRFSSFVRKTPERKTHARTVYVAHLSASKGREQSVRSDCAVHPSLFDVDQMQKTRIELCAMLQEGQRPPVFFSVSKQICVPRRNNARCSIVLQV